VYDFKMHKRSFCWYNKINKISLMEMLKLFSVNVFREVY
jgi:hypothetical protein